MVKISQICGKCHFYVTAAILHQLYLNPHLIHGSFFGPTWVLNPNGISIDPYLQDSLLWQTDRQTDRPTDNVTRSVTVGHIYSTAMRLKTDLIYMTLPNLCSISNLLCCVCSLLITLCKMEELGSSNLSAIHQKPRWTIACIIRSLVKTIQCNCVGVPYCVDVGIFVGLL